MDLEGGSDQVRIDKWTLSVRVIDGILKKRSDDLG